MSTRQSSEPLPLENDQCPSVILTLDELLYLAEAPRRPRWAAREQLISWLERNRITYILSLKGWPVVSLAHLEYRLGVPLQDPCKDVLTNYRPNMEAVNG